MTAILFIFKSAALPALIFIPLSIWSRLALRQHSLGQTVLGAALASAIMTGIFSAYLLAR